MTESKATRARAGTFEPQTPPADRRRGAQLGAVLLFAVIVAGVAIAVSASSTSTTSLRPGRPVPGASRAAALLAGIPQHGVSLGSPAAPVTLVEFADLQCPFCRQYATDALPALIQRYVRPGKLQLVFRNLSVLGADSLTAARFATGAAQQNRLWNFIDVWYANQQPENSGYVTASYLRAIAAGVPGLNVGRLELFSHSAAAQAQLKDANSLAGAYGIASTPSFLIGRTGGPLHVLSGVEVTAASFASAVNQVLAGR